MKRLRLLIIGLVQGVSFRAHTQAEARRLGLVGCVWNRSDGSVELVAEGPAEALEALLAWARQGPSHARVSSIEPEWGAATGEHDEFSIVRGGDR